MDHTGPGGQGAAGCSKLTLCFPSAHLALGNSAAQEGDARRAYGKGAVLVTLLVLLSKGRCLQALLPCLKKKNLRYKGKKRQEKAP